MPEYYLDTTALLEALGGRAATRREIREKFNGETQATSSLVIREWKRIVDGCLIQLEGAIRDAEDLTDVLSHVGRGYHRTPAQRAKTLAIVVGGNKEISLSDLQFRLRLLRRQSTAVLYAPFVGEVRDRTECDLAREEISANGQKLSLKTTCRKRECLCRQDDALEQDRPRAIAAAQAVEAGSLSEKDVKSAKKAVAVLQEPPENRKGANCYKEILGGDISIALECGTDETLLSSDRVSSSFVRLWEFHTRPSR